MGKLIDTVGLNEFKNKFIAKILNEGGRGVPTGGTANQILRSNGDGTSRWDSAATSSEIGSAVTSWLNTNVPTGTTVAIDKSLTVENAAAEAKATGQKIQALTNAVPYNFSPSELSYTLCDDVTKNSIIFISSSGGVSTYSDYPFTGQAGWLITLPASRGNTSLILQFAVAYNAPNPMMVRSRTFSGWNDWKFMAQNDDIEKILMNQLSLYPAGISLNQVKKVYNTDTFSIEYDFNRNMYHVVGTSPEYLNANFCLYANALPNGMRAGEKYNFIVHVEDQQTEKNPSYGPIEFFITTTTVNTWTMLSSVYSNGFNTIIPITIPDGANGFLARFAPRAEREYDFYFSVQIMPDSIVPPTAVVSYLSSYCKNLQTSFSYTSCDDVDESSVLFVSVTNGVKRIPDFPINGPGWLFTYPAMSLRLQFAVAYLSSEIVSRRKDGSTWTSWTSVAGEKLYLQSCDLNTVQTSGFWLLADSETYQNVPNNNRTGFLEVKISSNWVKQFFYEIRTSRSYVRTFAYGTLQATWAEIGSGDVYNVTQNIARNSYSNTYNITTSPQITIDSNGWLQAIDNENTLEADATDMSGAIMSMLNTTGYCHLGPGTFYVSGNIDMPYGAILEGCGEKTIVRLLSSVNDGYIVRLIRRNTVRGIKFSGGKNAPTNLYTDGTNLGSRHGIYLIGNADGQDSAQPAVENSIINDCWFEFFDGSAFYAYNTGGGLHQGVIMSSCYFCVCRVGINIDYYFEYAKVTDCVIRNCYYACINNGGNNVFTSCTFHGVVGMLFDNSANDKSNNSHGSCVGCTFNHIDNMNNSESAGNGLAIHMINCTAGFIFTGCQLWYGNVKIENSRAVAFSDCLFGNSGINIEVTGGWPAFFYDNMFYTTPTLNVNADTKFVNNYESYGTLVTA